MCTGGFRTRNGIEHALREDGIDLIGIGRPAASDPEWIERLLGLSESAARGKKQHNTDSCVPFKVSGGRWLMRLVPLKLVGGGLTTLWHELQMSRMGRGEKTKVEWSFERLLIVEFLHSSMAYFVGIAILVTVLAVYVAYQ